MSRSTATPGAGALDALAKPRLRGVIHQYAFFVTLAIGAALIVLAPPGEATVAAAVYSGAVCLMFGASALYHRGAWSPPVRRWLRRLDHSMIFVLIAGTLTPFAVLVLSGTLATVLLAVVWGGALAGVLMKLLWIDAPRWLGAGLYVVLGWVAAAAVPQVAGHLGPVALALFVAGGVAYTIGAVVYARRRPDPAPAVFGYHEIFHLLVVLAAAAHYVAVAFFVLPTR